MTMQMTDPAAAMHDAARITDWEKVLHLCESNPEYASYSGADGWTALHHACNRRCPRPEVFEALIKAYPEALLEQEDKGWLPLHYACRFKAPTSAVKLLLQMDPSKGKIAVSQTENLGRTPLYYAVRYDAPPGVVGLLLEVNPGAVLEEDQNEESPLALTWNTWADRLEGKRAIQGFLPGGYSVPEGCVTQQDRTEFLWKKLRGNKKLLKRWQKVNMLLKAAFGFPVEDEASEATTSASIGSERTWRILHAASAVKVHLSLFRLASALHPEQATELDESDLRRPSDPMLSGVSTHQTALHLAASSNAGSAGGKAIIQDLLDLYRNAAHVQDAVDGSLPLHLIVENKNKQDWPNFGALLCHVYPRALQIPDHSGKLPLHRAAAAISNAEASDDYMERSVVMNVVRLCPQAAAHLDNTGCFPLHILSMRAEAWDDQAQSIHNAHPAAVQSRTGPSLENRLPLHLAAGNRMAGESLILRLVRLHPRGASMTDRQGKLPVHLACEVGREMQNGLSAIHDAFTNGIQTPESNSRGWLPLHIASYCTDSSGGLIQELVELDPSAASVADSKGRYPLHLACAAGKKWDGGLQVLFDACSDAGSAADSAGRLPFFIVALRNAVSPLHDGQESLSELEALYQLLRADPSIL